MKKISDDLINRLINALINTVGLTYVQVQNLLNELTKLESIEQNGKSSK
jgi:hypothetical protein